MRRAPAVLFSLAILGFACGPGDRESGGGAIPGPGQGPRGRADSLYAEGAFSEARDLWLEDLRQVRAAGDDQAAAALLTSLGLAARHLGDYASSRAWGEEALELKLRLGLDGELFRSYNALGLLAWTEGRLDDASRLFTEASRAAAAVGDDLSVAKALANMAQIDTDRGEWSSARRGFQALEQASRAAADTLLLGRALINLAMLDIRNGDPLPSLAALEEARRLARAVGDPEAEENALGQSATAYRLLGEPQRAFAALDSALDLAQRHGLPRQAAEDVKLLGDLHAAAGDHRGALDHYGQARVLAEGLGLVDETGNLLLAEAESFRALGLTDSASVRAERASRLHREAGYREAEVQGLLLLAEIAADRRADGEADELLAEAMTLAQALESPVARTRVALVAARTADRRGDPESVLDALGSASDVFGRLGETDTWEPDALRARAYASLGRLDAAEAAGRRSLEGVERVRSAYGSPSLRTSLLSARAEVYADLVLVLLRQDKVAEAFEVADAARGRALLDHLGAARSELESGAGAAEQLLRASDLLRLIDELVRRLQALEGRSPRDRSSVAAPSGDSLQARLDAARSEYERLVSRLAQVPEKALLGTSSPQVENVQRLLQPDEVLLEYMVLDRSLEVFALRRSGLFHVSVPMARDALAAQVRLAIDLASGGATGPSPDRVYRALHDALVDPVARAGALEGSRRLVLVPHGPLVYLPFAALQGHDGAPLAQRYSLLFLPSASALAALRTLDSGRSGSPGRAALVLAPLPEELPGSRREAADVASALGIEGSRTILGPAATEGALRRGLESSRIVHVATHGVMNALNPMFTRVDLRPGGRGDSRDDGRLEVREILGVHVAADLVYLSGCETGRATAWSTGFETGEDYATLAQALLYAGARNVVATLWRVPDDGAAAFAARFYAALERGDPVEALSAAQRHLLSDPRYRAPYYWAAYQVTGSGGL